MYQNPTVSKGVTAMALYDNSNAHYKHYADQVKHFEVVLYHLPRKFLAPHELQELEPMRVTVEASVFTFKTNCDRGSIGEVREIEVHQFGMNPPVDPTAKGGFVQALRAAIRRAYDAENIKVIIPVEALAE